MPEIQQCHIKVSTRETKTHVEKDPLPEAVGHTSKENESAEDPMAYDVGGTSGLTTMVQIPSISEI